MTLNPGTMNMKIVKIALTGCLAGLWLVSCQQDTRQNMADRAEEMSESAQDEMDRMMDRQETRQQNTDRPGMAGDRTSPGMTQQGRDPMDPGAGMRQQDLLSINNPDEFRSVATEMITEHEKEIAELREEVQSRREEIRPDFEERITNLEERNQEVRERLSAIGQSGEAEWQSLRQEIDQQIDEIESEIDVVRTELQEME